MAQESIGLNDHHENLILQYLRFTRYQRGLRLRSFEACFDDGKIKLATDSTFTSEEVTDILDELKDVVRGEAECELLNSYHTNALLLRQMCKQAEEWHLKLTADVSELENRELLDQIRQFEEKQLSMQAAKRLSIKLEPMQGGAAQLLKAQIDKLKDENVKLRGNLNVAENNSESTGKQKEKLLEELERAYQDLQKQKSQSGATDDDILNMQMEVQNLKATLENDLRLSKESQGQLESDLVGSKKKLLEIREQLELTEQELEKKFSQTKNYQNMKKILTQKNNVIKSLRKKLSTYEPDFTTYDED